MDAHHAHLSGITPAPDAVELVVTSMRRAHGSSAALGENENAATVARTEAYVVGIPTPGSSLHGPQWLPLGGGGGSLHRARFAAEALSMRLEPLQEAKAAEGAALSQADAEAAGPSRALVGVLIVGQLLFILLFAIFGDYAGEAYNPSGQASMLSMYPQFQDVNVMMLLGFGFLMTFLRKYGFSAVGFNFLLTAFVLQWHVISFAIISYWWAGSVGPLVIAVSLQGLILAEFAVAAVLISFGAVIGKVGPAQLLVMCAAETVLYAVNENVAATLGVADAGGSLVIHVFGAFFGLAVSKVVTPASALQGCFDNVSSYRSDQMSMIGTLLLWAFWPSFNSALSGDSSRQRAVINTLLSLCGSCTAAFLASSLFRNRFSMVDVQNATLAGGVAIGAAAAMVVSPAGAIAVGCLAGFMSVAGFAFVQAWAEKTLGLTDSCGVLHLHGNPGLLAGFVSCVAAAVASPAKYSSGSALAEVIPAMGAPLHRTGSAQATYQLAFIFCSLGLAVVGGAATGGVLLRMQPAEPRRRYFVDSTYWEVPVESQPAYTTSTTSLQPGGSIHRSADQSVRLGAGFSANRGPSHV